MASIYISDPKHTKDGKEYFLAAATCSHCKETVELKHQFTKEEIKKLYDYLTGKSNGYIQDELPFLTADEREQILSGICPDCYKKIFKQT